MTNRFVTTSCTNAYLPGELLFFLSESSSESNSVHLRLFRNSLQSWSHKRVLGLTTSCTCKNAGQSKMAVMSHDSILSYFPVFPFGRFVWDFAKHERVYSGTFQFHIMFFNFFGESVLCRQCRKVTSMSGDICSVTWFWRTGTSILYFIYHNLTMPQSSNQSLLFLLKTCPRSSNAVSIVFPWK